MKIDHIISSIDKSSGGPSRSVTQLIRGILNFDQSILVNLITLKSKNPVINTFQKGNGRIEFFTIKELSRSLKNSNSHLFHGHGLWQRPVHQMAKIARNKNIPYIISPRGMLDTWPLRHKWLKKRIARILFQDRDLKLASVIHATSETEAANIRVLGFKNPIAIIPNGVRLTNIIKTDQNPGIKKMLFLSRIVKNKGIEELLEAFSCLEAKVSSNWELNIVGHGKPEYSQKLKQKTKMLNLNNVNFLGPLYDSNKKKKIISESDLFVLPSYSENFGMVVAEALACGTPVITTKGTPWQDLETYNCGWWIDRGVQPLKEALENVMQTKESDLKKMGKNGRQLIKAKYSIKIVASQMLELYQWILEKGGKPEFIDD